MQDSQAFCYLSLDQEQKIFVASLAFLAVVVAAHAGAHLGLEPDTHENRINEKNLFILFHKFTEHYYNINIDNTMQNKMTSR